MSLLRRYYLDRRLFFITVVTYKRQPILFDHHKMLNESVRFVQTSIKFNVLAYVVLPDHLHAIIDTHGNNLSDIVRRTKQKFAGLYRSQHCLKSGRLWQHRFWDHAIRNQEDLNKHIDYIHFNPMKHALVEGPNDFELSSFQDYQARGLYQQDWGVKEKPNLLGAYGE